jgi:ADP-heptose:LPS heptosyltransferase
MNAGGGSVPEPAAADPRDYERVLVIRLGALGDFVLSLGPMAAIRRHHAKARITLLTTPPFASLGRASPYCDEVTIDERAPWWQPWRVLALARRLRRGGFQRVYDLQTSGRTARYWRAMGRPEWSGHAGGASHAHLDGARDTLHTVERQKAQLKLAGIEDVPAADLSWVDADVRRFGARAPYVLFVPGGSAHRPKKRWPAEKFTALARTFVRLGIAPVLIGGEAEAAVLGEIAGHVPEGVNLCGKTSFEEVAVLGRAALGAIGNDTGPMHLIAAAGAPSLVLFSGESDPDLCAPRPGARGGKVAVLRKPDLVALSVAEVQAALPFALQAKR